MVAFILLICTTASSRKASGTKADSYLRPKIQQKRLDLNVGRGRIFRLVHDDYKPSKVKPHMLEETSAQLVEHLKQS
jgi:hypothetical protein